MLSFIKKCGIRGHTKEHKNDLINGKITCLEYSIILKDITVFNIKRLAICITIVKINPSINATYGLAPYLHKIIITGKDDNVIILVIN